VVLVCWTTSFLNCSSTWDTLHLHCLPAPVLPVHCTFPGRTPGPCAATAVPAFLCTLLLLCTCLPYYILHFHWGPTPTCSTLQPAVPAPLPAMPTTRLPGRLLLPGHHQSCPLAACTACLPLPLPPPCRRPGPTAGRLRLPAPAPPAYLLGLGGTAFLLVLFWDGGCCHLEGTFSLHHALHCLPACTAGHLSTHCLLLIQVTAMIHWRFISVSTSTVSHCHCISLPAVLLFHLFTVHLGLTRLGGSACLPAPALTPLPYQAPTFPALLLLPAPALYISCTCSCTFLGPSHHCIPTYPA